MIIKWMKELWWMQGGAGGGRVGYDAMSQRQRRYKIRFYLMFKLKESKSNDSGENKWGAAKCVSMAPILDKEMPSFFAIAFSLAMVGRKHSLIVYSVANIAAIHVINSNSK